MSRLVLRLALVAVLASGTTAADPVGTEAGAAAAGRFATEFLHGRHEANLEAMTPEMRAAMGPAAAEALRKQLLAAHGALVSVGDAWSEDRVQGFDRFRVPVELERQTLDLRVVLDGERRIAGLFLVPHAPPPSPDEGEPRFREVEMLVGPEGRELPGLLTLPDGPGPHPAAVLVHGSGPNDRDETIGPNKPFRDLARGLAGLGVASLRYDKRSHARPGDLAEVGDALTVREEVIDDAQDAIRRLGRRGEVDESRVFVIGHSLGGSLAPRIGAMTPRPAGLVVLAGSTLPLPEKMLEQVRYIAALDGGISEEERSRIATIESEVRRLRSALADPGDDPAGTILGAPVGYYRDLEAHDPPREAQRLGLPILVLQGARDYQVTDADFRRWKSALEGRKFACLASYDGLDHLFRRGEGPSGPHDYDRAAPVDAVVIGAVAAWIRERRCPA